MAAARAVVWGFALGAETGAALLLAHFNPRCAPPWDEWDVVRACDRVSADGEKPRGYLLADQSDTRSQRTPHPQADLANAGFPELPAGTLNHSSWDAIRAELGDPADCARVSSPSPPHPQAGGQSASGGSSTPPQRKSVENYKIVTQSNGEGGQKVGTTPQEITDKLLWATGGWPKRVGSRLFVPNPDFTPRWLDSASSLFAWLSGCLGYTGGRVDWGRGPGMIDKGEYFHHLAAAVEIEAFDDLQLVPHAPAMPRTYYMHPPLPHGGTGALNELIEFFSPATETDRHLIHAFALTLAWGGKLGGRPVFVFELASEEMRAGQGSGKSTIATKLGKLFGGHVSLSLSDVDDSDIQTRLLSNEAASSRLVLFDNMKGTRMSSPVIESFITAEVISGKRLYQGEGRRPNNLTWAITMNKPSLSKDLAQRVVPIQLAMPKYDPTWDEQIDRFINEHRWAIVADVVAELNKPQLFTIEDGKWSRWAMWEREVLCRVCDPSVAVGVMRGRREHMDADDESSEQVQDAIAEYLNRTLTRLPDNLKMKMSLRWLKKALEPIDPIRARSVDSVGAWLKRLNLDYLKYLRTNSRRYWIWIGKNTTADTPIEEFSDKTI